VISRQEVELSLISWLHELLEHFNFLLRHAKLEVDLSFDFRGRIHTSRGINTEDNRGVVLSHLTFMGTLKHVDNIVFFWDFLFLDLQNIWIQAELTFPKRLILL
jgi:hypothetical protein